MSRKTTAEQMLQKLKQKKQQQQKIRPHQQVFRLQAAFAFQFHNQLKDSITRLQHQINKAKQTRDLFESHLEDYQNTGKQSFPRIVVKPQFIASDNVSSQFKDFYRKTSNSFLRVDLLINKKHLQSSGTITRLFQRLQSMKAQEQIINTMTQRQRKIFNEKRMKILKQDLRLREIKNQQQKLRQLISNDRQANKELVKQYEIKKGNLQSRKDRSKVLLDQIKKYQKQIEESFNPVAYRQHLKNLFDATIKNEVIQKNLQIIQNRVSKLQKQKESLEKICQKTNSISKLGRINDSPSLKKRANKSIQSYSKHTKYAFFDSLKGPKSRTQKSLDVSKKISLNSTLKSIFQIDSIKTNVTPKRISFLASERRYQHKNLSDFFKR